VPSISRSNAKVVPVDMLFTRWTAAAHGTKWWADCLVLHCIMRRDPTDATGRPGSMPQ
jgi:hypothetical protein